MAERISEAEHAVLEVLWDESPLSAAAVARRTAPKRGWSLQTVKTLLSRLQGKHAVDYELDGRAFLYRPIIKRDDHVSTQARGLLDRLFDGRPAYLVAHLADRGDLTAGDIEELEALLRDLKA